MRDLAVQRRRKRKLAVARVAHTHEKIAKARATQKMQFAFGADFKENIIFVRDDGNVVDVNGAPVTLSRPASAATTMTTTTAASTIARGDIAKWKRSGGGRRQRLNATGGDNNGGGGDFIVTRRLNGECVVEGDAAGSVGLFDEIEHDLTATARVTLATQPTSSEATAR
jgi:hypothetical protein